MTLKFIKNGIMFLLDSLASRDSKLSMILVHIFSLNKMLREQNIHMLRLGWLDENNDNLKKILAPEMEGLSYGPVFLNGVQKSDEIIFPSVKIYYFRNASVSVESSSILLNNRKIIIERVEGIDHQRGEYTSGHVFMHGKRTALVSKRPTDYLDKGIFLGGNGSYNYFHWLIEILPKVRWLQDIDEEYQAFPLLVSEDVSHISSFREALDLLVKDHPLVMLKKTKTYHVGSLVYINAPNNLPFNLRRKEKTKVSDAYIRPDSINYLRERLLVNSGNNLNFNTKRIFFARRTNRRNYNQDEVFAVFEKEGFMKVFMEDLSLREQIDLMSDAEIIAGPTGAAWTNLIFCTEGTKCLCWMAEEFKEFSGYSNLAHIVGADLRYITYKAGTQSSRDLYELAYHLDIKKIENALSSLLRATS